MVRRSRLLMRVASSFAVIAVVQAMAVQPMLACERHDAGATHQAAATNSSASTHDSDCADQHAPAPGQHDDSCVATCLTMAGCSTPCFIVESTVALNAIEEAMPPSVGVQSHPSRFLTPDRPPPRV